MDQQTAPRPGSAIAGCVSAAGAGVGPARFCIGIIFLAVSIAAAGMMALEHLGGLRLPGCGAGSPCAQASQSVWGSVPYVNWPVSYLGLAYFAGLLVAWILMRAGVAKALLWLVRLGVLASVGFVLVMIRGRYACPYCLATHVGNLGFWLLLETAPRAPRRRWQPVAAAASVFVAATVALGVFESRVRHEVLAVAEADAQSTGAAILAASTQPAAAEAAAPPATAAARPASRTADQTGVVGLAAGGAAPVPAGPAALRPTSAVASVPASEPSHRGFTGRYRLGPEASPLRIVIFMDYMCKGCHLLEIELKQLFTRCDIISLSVKQSPMNPECNPFVRGEREHENACRAARAAETAGLLHGNDGFWQMHFWLFDHNGRFTDEELRAALAEFGYDADEFERVMNSDEPLRLIQADSEEAFELGLASTPMVFINGHEFKGWSAPLGITRLVDKLSTKDLPALTAEHDQPPAALERYITEWKASRVRDIPSGARAWTCGSHTPTLSIIAWGDYRQPNSALADGIIRDFLTTHPEAQYTFRFYPLDPECNPGASDERYPLSCLAARAAEAAGRLGGQEGFWKMHVWLMENQQNFSEQTLRAALPGLGFETAAFVEAMNDPAVAEAVAADGKAAEEQQLRNAPLMFVKNKVIPRWLHGKQPLLREMLEAAARE
jgi:protein-disulfide isomerase/uncharacterized membrane protein